MEQYPVAGLSCWNIDASTHLSSCVQMEIAMTEAGILDWGCLVVQSAVISAGMATW